MHEKKKHIKLNIVQVDIKKYNVGVVYQNIF